MSLNPTTIEWTHSFGPGSGYTWNPITGCTEGWDDRLRDVTPRQKPRGIFVGSMGDMWDSAVPQEWRDRVWQAMAQAPQHVYFTLTKQPQNVSDWDTVAWGDTCVGAVGGWWRGVTITTQQNIRPAYWDWWPDFVSFEPLLGPVCLGAAGWHPEWIIIGADSRPAGVAHFTEPAWVEHLVADAEAAQIPVFAKDNLARVMGADWVRAHQQWPAELRKLREEGA